MKLVDFKHSEDYGHDVYIILFRIKSWCFIQSCISTMEFCPSWPYLNITMGNGRLIAISFHILLFAFTFEIFSRSWFK